MKILVLNGSPKQKSDTLRLTEAFLKGLNSAKVSGHEQISVTAQTAAHEHSSGNPHEVNTVHVIEGRIEPCRGCFECWKKMDGHCVIEDDQNQILDLYREADLIIWSFPLYCCGMPSHLKAVLDRTIPLIKMKMIQEADGSVRHEALVDFSRKHTLVICGCGFPDWEGNFDSLKLQCRQCFGNLTMVCVPEAPMLNVPAAAVVADPLLARFEKAGEEYARDLALSPATLAALEHPMIPKEQYIRIVNGEA